jgi:hypothetical protein
VSAARENRPPHARFMRLRATAMILVAAVLVATGAASTTACALDPRCWDPNPDCEKGGGHFEGCRCVTPIPPSYGDPPNCSQDADCRGGGDGPPGKCTNYRCVAAPDRGVDAGSHPDEDGGDAGDAGNDATGDGSDDAETEDAG